jgi:hypothetical protein
MGAVGEATLNSHGLSGVPPGGCATTSHGFHPSNLLTTEVTEGHRGRQEIQRKGTARIQSLTVSALLLSSSVLSVTSVVKKRNRGFDYPDRRIRIVHCTLLIPPQPSPRS